MEMKVLLSIKPEYAKLIFNQSKKYEFRRVIFKNQKVKTVLVYASSPVKGIIGEFEIDSIISNAPDLLWEQTKYQSGIKKNKFFKYFANKEIGFAIKIKSVNQYQELLCPRENFSVFPPQSFCYVR